MLKNNLTHFCLLKVILRNKLINEKLQPNLFFQSLLASFLSFLLFILSLTSSLFLFFFLFLFEISALVPDLDIQFIKAGKCSSRCARQS